MSIDIGDTHTKSVTSISISDRLPNYQLLKPPNVKLNLIFNTAGCFISITRRLTDVQYKLYSVTRRLTDVQYKLYSVTRRLTVVQYKLYSVTRRLTDVQYKLYSVTRL